MPTRILSLFLVFLSVLMLGGCGKARYPIDLDPEHKLVGRTYELTRDCYIFTWKSYKPPFPVFTTHPPAQGLGLPELPEPVSGAFIGQKVDTFEIIGLIKKGTRFRVARVYRVSPEDNRFDIYQVDVLDPFDPAFPKLDAYWLTDHRPGKPHNPAGFAPEYVREVKE